MYAVCNINNLDSMLMYYALLWGFCKDLLLYELGGYHDGELWGGGGVAQYEEWVNEQHFFKMLKPQIKK